MTPRLPSTFLILVLLTTQWGGSLGQVCDLDCENGGKCEIAPPDPLHELGFPRCDCPAGYLGDLCEESGPEITGEVETPACDLICENGGKCELAPPDDANPEGFQYCICPSGYKGDLCDQGGTESPPDTTNGETNCDLGCQNGGECQLLNPNPTNPSGSPQCICSPDYNGDLCEVSVENPCDLECQNGGQCQMLPPDEQNINGFKYCLCPSGLLGDFCERGEPETPCDLQCLNGGTCEWGMSGSENPDDAFKYCLCPAETEGALCEKAISQPCGEHPCDHGGTCVDGNEGERYCDCTTSNHPSIHYAGLYCEYAATTYCTPSQQYFCVNDGTCVNQGDGTYSCDCPEGWSGPSCEFESQDRDHNFENCTLTCLNGGGCRKGAKDMSAVAGLGPELSHLADEASHSESFEHCVCPDGFTGLKCEHEYEECGNGEHMCLHGSKCVPPKNELHPVWTCECEEAFREDHMYAGKFCQHHHTSTCTTDDAQNQVYLGYKSLAFCVNDGVCIDVEENGERRPGCRCPRGWIGAHCELLDTELHQDGPPLKNETSGVAALIFFLAVLLVLAGVLILVVILRYRRGKDWGVESAHLTQDQSTLGPGQYPGLEEVNFKDEDGIMEDVELL